jgi:RNA polymerase sigma-70 factor (ECF subfamily)
MKPAINTEIRKKTEDNYYIHLIIEIFLMSFILLQSIRNMRKCNTIGSLNNFYFRAIFFFLISWEVLYFCFNSKTEAISLFLIFFFEEDVLSLREDKELVSQCLSGSEEAWLQLYRRTYNTIQFVTHWKKWHFSNEEAEEIMQDVFMSLITSLRTFNFGCSMETFASNIAKNRCISEIRRITAAKREGDKDSISIYDTDEEGVPRVTLEDTQSSFEDTLQKDETRILLESALNSIGEKCREIINLKYYENRSYDEIVSLLNIPMGTMASRLKRCLLELRRICEKHKGDLF